MIPLSLGTRADKDGTTIPIKLNTNIQIAAYLAPREPIIKEDAEMNVILAEKPDSVPGYSGKSSSEKSKDELCGR